MTIKTIIDEDFTNFRVPAMFIGTATCGGKCCIEAGLPLSVCQNDGWRNSAIYFMDDNDLCQRYLCNDITKAIVFGGLEPFEQFEELFFFIDRLRNIYKCHDPVVIYTGYNKDEIWEEIRELSTCFDNVIVKFGRFKPGFEPHFDEVLGVDLASPNQYAEMISIKEI